MKNLAVALKSFVVAVAVPFVAVACCSDVKDPDDQLTVEVDEEAASGGDEVQTENRCDAEVIAYDEDGGEVALEEAVRDNSDGSTRCVYIATVDPAKLYTVEVRKDGKVGFAAYAESNPACSVRTDPADTDNNILLRDLGPHATLYRAPSSTTSPSPVVGADTRIAR